MMATAMVAVRLFTRAEIESRFAPYRCRLVRALPDGSELWETGWGEPFVMVPEQGDRYDEWQYRKALANVIGPTMPSNWHAGGLN
jgi:hypothetical protein